MSALDLIIGTLDSDTIYAQSYYWGAYRNIMISNNVNIETYPDFDWLYENVEELNGKAIIICDPNNPLGTKYDDMLLLELVKYLTLNNVTVIWDGPYRRLFTDNSDFLYQELASNDNLIITESFSKSIGLPGQRLGFIYVKDKDFGEELNIRVLYTTNGINTFAQILVTKLFSTFQGQQIINNFKKATVKGISENIEYLKKNGLLTERYYQNASPVGIFAVVNKTYQELLDNRIGSVPLEFFTPNKEEAKDNSRICVSIPHEKFVKYFNVFEAELAN
jgi:aspartate/methionine/tyrosine aminotransferase